MKEWGKQVRWYCIFVYLYSVKLGFLDIQTLCKLRNYFVESESSLKNKAI